MAEEERDPEKRLLLESMVQQLQAATAGKPLSEVQAAFANTIAIMCLSLGPDIADEIFISMQGDLVEVYLAMRTRVRQGGTPKVVN